MGTTPELLKATSKPAKQVVVELTAFAQRCELSALAPAKAITWLPLVIKFIGFIAQRCGPTEPAVAGDLVTTNARLLRKASKEKCPNDVRKHVMIPSGIKAKGAQDEAFVTLMAQAAAEKDKTSSTIASFCTAYKNGEITLSE